MSTALVPRQASVALMPAAVDLSIMLELGKQLHASGLLPPHIKNAAAALAIIQKGRELGIPPMQACACILFIGSRATCNAELMLALIYRDQGNDALAFEESTDQQCTISYRRRGWSARRSYTYTRQMATAAGLSGGNWTKYPAAMLRARCISAVARMAFPDTIGGMHTPEELGAAVAVDADGAVVVEPPTPAETTDDPATRKQARDRCWKAADSLKLTPDALAWELSRRTGKADARTFTTADYGELAEVLEGVLGGYVDMTKDVHGRPTFTYPPEPAQEG